MKIDTSSPRLPINRLKHPLKQKAPLPENENQIYPEEKAIFLETFERLIIQDGAFAGGVWQTTRSFQCH